MRLLISLLWLACLSVPAFADACPHRSDVIGTSRSITVDPSDLPLIGTMQYKSTLPLADHEVVITFDDGPLPPFTTHVLETLRENCAKATFFLVGEMARAHPWLVRRIYNDGHTIGTHSESHPLALNRKRMAVVEREVEAGIASVTTAAGDPRAVAPFFRIPGLARSSQIETYLAARSLAVWSADEVADDWFRGIGPDQIVRRALDRLAQHDQRGVLLLHDIHPATALALPKLLTALKERGYRLVQVLAPGERPVSVPELAVPPAATAGFPRIAAASAAPLARLAPHLPRRRGEGPTR
ncbi:MAG: polysaccharide deacetylase family protein [Pseudolabrys sp.]|nr:polysaccharide deacetylase family protein [Pseudolabrys sp.]